MKIALLIPVTGPQNSGYVWMDTRDNFISPLLYSREIALECAPEGYRLLDDAWKEIKNA